FVGDVRSSTEAMLADTTAYWMHWVRTLAVPLEWQEAVIRAAITLKLCAYEETGAVVAAMTTSIPEAPGSGRNWDYRYCWLRDAYYVVQALNRLGAADILERYLGYLRNIVDRADAGIWELRTRAEVHTYSAVMCWAACDRLGNAAEKLGRQARAKFWNAR